MWGSASIILSQLSLSMQTKEHDVSVMCSSLKRINHQSQKNSYVQFIAQPYYDHR